MSRLWSNLLSGLAFVWKSVAAVVAMVAIVAALIGGIWLGRNMGAASQSVSTQAAHTDETGAAGEHEQTVQWYYCSMHPQIRSTDPDAKCPICFMDLIPVKEGDVGGLRDESGPRELLMSEAAMKLAEIQTAPVARFFPTGEVRLVGKIQYDETKLATIAAYVPGRLDRLFVDYTGMQVQQGDHLVEIYSPELIAAQAELTQASQAVTNEASTSDLIRRSNLAKLQAVRDKLRLWGLNADQIAELERSEGNAERFTVYSPLGGVVTERMATEGQYVSTGQPIYKVADLSTVWLNLQAYESQLGWLRYGQDVEFTTEAYPGEAFHGSITFIDPVLDQGSRTTRVRVNVSNEEGRLKPGMFARAVVRAKMGLDGVVFDSGLHGQWICPMHPEVVKAAAGTCDVCGMALVPAETLGYVEHGHDETPPLVVPATAPLITGARAVVYVQDTESEFPSFEGREVILGSRAGAYYIVREGLREGERVVVNGAFKIDSALQIASKVSMMSPQDSGAAGEPARDAAQRMSVPPAFLESLSPVYAAYLTAQAALAADDLEQYRQAETDVRSALADVTTDGMHGESLGTWQRLTREVMSEGHPMFAGAAADLDDARHRFDVYSVVAIGLIEQFGQVHAQTLYKAHCPMAFDNRGADWIQLDGQTVSNPYYGEMMLRCGSIEGAYEEVHPAGPGGEEEGGR